MPRELASCGLRLHKPAHRYTRRIHAWNEFLVHSAGTALISVRDTGFFNNVTGRTPASIDFLTLSTSFHIASLGCGRRRCAKQNRPSFLNLRLDGRCGDRTIIQQDRHRLAKVSTGHFPEDIRLHSASIVKEIVMSSVQSGRGTDVPSDHTFGRPACVSVCSTSS